MILVFIPNHILFYRLINIYILIIIHDSNSKTIHQKISFLLHIRSRYSYRCHIRPHLSTKCTITITQYLLHQEWPSYYLLTISNFLLYALCFISFAQCIRINCNIPNTVPVPRNRTQLRHNHHFYT